MLELRVPGQVGVQPEYLAGGEGEDLCLDSWGLSNYPDLFNIFTL